MDYAVFIDFLAQITELSQEFTDALIQNLKQEKYKAHQIIHAAGQIENRIWFLKTGFARSYYFDQTGKEHTLNFFTEKHLIFSFKGFWREASDYYVEVVSESVLLSLSYDMLNNLSQNFKETNLLILVFARQFYYQEAYKCRLMTWAAEERYFQFRRLQPQIFKIASVRLIASYLNMTRENLSRLMGKDL